MNIDLTPIFQAVIALLGVLITYKVIPWIQARTTNEQQEGMRAVVRTLVYAAEQLYGAGKGPEKLAWVKDKLNAAGFDVDPAEIEAAVYANMLGALITYKVIPWIQACTNNEQQEGIRAIVRTLVYAAEQLYGAGKGPEKLEWVKDKLNAAGFDVDPAEIDAAVYANINSGWLTLKAAGEMAEAAADVCVNAPKQPPDNPLDAPGE